MCSDKKEKWKLITIETVIDYDITFKGYSV